MIYYSMYLLFILLIQGLIHLMGFSKAYGCGNIYLVNLLWKNGILNQKSSGCLKVSVFLVKAK
jgi:hypothetical protein